MEPPSYVPNNPQFGVQFECNWSATSLHPAALPGIADDDLSAGWTETEDMGSFALPIDLDPLPSLFPFAQDIAVHPHEPQQQQHSGCHYKQPAEMADVLLSLKHAVVHPNASLEDTRWDCEQHLSPIEQPTLFPAMSVNVSMNMTMHGFHSGGGYPSSELGYPQWSPAPVPTPISYQSQGLHTSGYTFTADFQGEVGRKQVLGGGGQTLQKPNVCRICGKSYARPSTLKTHLRTHSGEKPFRCADCSKSFSQAANLTAHVRTHSGEKPFRCPVCDRRFSQSSSVTTHMRTHSGERPYRCRLCRKAFSDSSTLTKHLRIHSGEKPYECKLCLLRFSQSGNLNRHMRVHAPGGGGLALVPL